MDEFSDYDIHLSKQECRLLLKTTSPSQTPMVTISPSSTPHTKDRKKNLDTLFGQHSNLYVVSQFCNQVKQHLHEGTNHKASTKAIMVIIKAMSEEGQLLEEKNMDEFSSECMTIAAAEDDYT